MKFLLLISILTNSLLCFGQQKQADTVHVKTIKGDIIATFLDSLKDKIFQDTSKFKRSDLIHTNIGTLNTKTYSPVFYVDMRYVYKLDIINGKLVNDFVNNILDPSKIASIEIVDTATSQAIFGIEGVNGAILITINKRAKVNYKVAGLSMTKKKKYGNNFNQRQDGEIKILF